MLNAGKPCTFRKICEDMERSYKTCSILQHLPVFLASQNPSPNSSNHMGPAAFHLYVGQTPWGRLSSNCAQPATPCDQNSTRVGRDFATFRTNLTDMSYMRVHSMSSPRPELPRRILGAALLHWRSRNGCPCIVGCG